MMFLLHNDIFVDHISTTILISYNTLFVGSLNLEYTTWFYCLKYFKVVILSITKSLVSIIVGF